MDFSDMTDKDILNIVEPPMNNFLEGFSEGDHAKHVKDFASRLKRIVTPEKLTN